MHSLFRYTKISRHEKSWKKSWYAVIFDSIFVKKERERKEKYEWKIKTWRTSSASRRVPNERKATKHAPILRHLTIPHRKTGRSVPGRNPCESILIGDAGSSHPGRPWAKTSRSSPLAPITNPLTIDHTEPLPSLPLTTSADHRGVDHRLPPPVSGRTLLHAPAFSARKIDTRFFHFEN